MAETYGVRRGQIVYSSDGMRLGRVFQCDESSFVVERGVVFAQDYPVFYEEVASVSAGTVHLRLPADALLPEEQAEAWDPPRDPEGTDGGIDLEPLRAGMAEIDEEQRRAAAGERGGSSRPDERARRAALALALHWGEERLEPLPPAPEVGGLDAAASSKVASELERRIEEEVDDYEREGSCAPRVAPAALRAGAAVSRRRRPVARRRGEGREPATGRGLPRPAAQAAASRLDYGQSAPGAVSALRQLETYVRRCGLEPSLLELIRLRASQLNGCEPCIDLHRRTARRAGETRERLDSLATWSETRYFTARERAALAWSEAVTQVGIARVDDETYAQAREQFDERELVDLTMAVVAINGWNRLAVAFRVEPAAYQLGLG